MELCERRFEFVAQPEVEGNVVPQLDIVLRLLSKQSRNVVSLAK